MEIKARKTFCSGKLLLSKGDVATVSDTVGLHLIKIGFAESLEAKADPVPEAPKKTPRRKAKK